MRTTDTSAVILARMRAPLPRTAVTRGRWVAGAVAAFGSFALLQIAGSAEAKTVTPAPTTPPAATHTVTYTLKNGDTLWDLAGKNHISVAALASANRISDVNKISAGEQIVLPVEPAPTPKVAPAPGVLTTTRTPAQIKAALTTLQGPNPRSTVGQALPAQINATPERLKLNPVFKQAADQYGVPQELLMAMAYNESGWQNKVVSSTGAVGVGQLMPDTIAFINQSLVSKQLDPGKADQNIKMSAAFLHYLLGQTGHNTRMALAAYYQGLTSVQKIGPFADTQQYVKNVLALQSMYF